MCLGLTLLAAYVAAVLASVWVREMLTIASIQSSAATAAASEYLDPNALATAQLRWLLDSRGVSYDDVLEKTELAKRVLNTGQPGAPELEAASLASVAHQPASRVFTHGAEFDEVVEDAKDSAWLVQVVPEDGRLAVEQKEWNMLRKRLSNFGIRFGVFSCWHDGRFCRLKEWDSPRLILALPRGYTAKADVFMRAYSGRAQAQAVQRWVATNFAARIKWLRTAEAVEEWFDFVQNSYSACKYPVRLLYVTSANTSSSAASLTQEQQQQVPLFFSALTVRFTGRVKFGRALHGVGLSSSWPGAAAATTAAAAAAAVSAASSTASYILTTPEGNYSYGSSPIADPLNMNALAILLTLLVPDANDLFIAACLLTNAACVLNIAVACGHRWRGIGYMARALWLWLKCNCLLLVLWLPSTAALAAMPSALQAASWLLRKFTLSQVGMLCRSAFLAATGGSNGNTVLSGSAAFLASFFIYYLCVTIASAVLAPWTSASAARGGGDREAVTGSPAVVGEGAWWDVLFRRQGGPDGATDSVVAPPVATAIAGQLAAASGDVEEGLRAALIIERLTAPSIWLQPYPTCDYVSELATWPYEARSADAKCDCSRAAETAAAGNRCNSPPSCSDADADVDCSVSAESGFAYGSNCKSSAAAEAPCKLCSDTGRHSQRPAHILQSDECPICLDNYRRKDVLSGLPCGHSFHQKCVLGWLQRDNSLCPLCRWPAFLRKSSLTKVHSE